MNMKMLMVDDEEEDISEDETRCQIFIDLGERCGKPLAAVVREPFTPASFEIECCQEHADSMLSEGYLKGQNKHD